MMVDPGTGEIRDIDTWTSQPPNSSAGLSILEVLSDELEAHTDWYAEALDSEAEAQNIYERAFAIAFIKNDDVQVTIRTKFTDAQVVEEKTAYNTAIAKSKRMRAKVAELTNRLTAAQSFLKWTGGQDGGAR